MNRQAPALSMRTAAGGLVKSAAGSFTLEQALFAAGTALIAAAAIPNVYRGISAYLLQFNETAPPAAAESIINVRSEEQQ